MVDRKKDLPVRSIDGIHRAFAEGVRQIHPIHLVDNGFGGSAIYNGEFNISNH